MSRTRAALTPFAVAAYIVAAVHRVHLVREAGGHHRTGLQRHVRRDPSGDVGAFLLAQALGATVGALLFS